MSKIKTLLFCQVLQTTFTSYMEKPKLPSNSGLRIIWLSIHLRRGRQKQINAMKDKTSWCSRNVKNQKSSQALDIIIIETIPKNERDNSATLEHACG